MDTMSIVGDDYSNTIAGIPGKDSSDEKRIE